MKPADITVRCATCDCYVELAGTPDDAPNESRQGTCHANPPAVVMVTTVQPARLTEALARGESTPQVMQQPATIFPVVSMTESFCAHHPQWGEPPEQLH